jgi:hypothetical protein
MPPPTTSSLLQTLDPLARVCVERRIFVGDDREVFIKDWLEPFDADYRYGRIEGYVLDLTGGRLWAALDLSDISDAAYRDIALRSIRPDDARASEAFLRLTRTCDPVTAVNSLTCSFAPSEWPKLAAACKVFTRRYAPLHTREEATSQAVVQESLEQELYESPSNDDVSWEFLPPDRLPSPIEKPAPGQSKHVFHCVLPDTSEKNLLESGDTTRCAGEILEVRVNEETAGLVEQMAGSPLPDPLDRKHTIVLLSCIEESLIYRRKLGRAQQVLELRTPLLPLANFAVARD